MNRIQKLSPEIIQQIAAGEIVERPAHMVKELLDNALDAGATIIDVVVKDGGKEYVQVRDNGHGMSRDDAIACFEHHATSKLRFFEDLQTISSYGFRGEALSSIASVSNVVLTTRTADSSEGTQVHNRGGKIVSVSVVAAPIGTEIIISDLFFNTPARKKFLKKTVTELNQISYLFAASSLQRLSVRYTLSNEGKILISCPQTDDLRERFLALEGAHFQQSIVPLKQKEQDGVTVTGIISDGNALSYDRNSFYFFVNARAIRNPSLMRSVLNGYKNHIPSGKYPRGAIFVTMDGHDVDINVHPKKEEVRFLHPRRIEALIERAVTETLEQSVPEMPKKTDLFSPSYTPPFATYSPHTVIPKSNDFASLQNISGEMTQNKNYQKFTNPVIPEFSESFSHGKMEHAVSQESIETHLGVEPRMEVIGQFLNTYIIAAVDDELIIVDQHAAHERILYEHYSGSNGEALSITLAFPVLITLQKTEIDLLFKETSLFAHCGIHLERFDATQLIVTATPAHLDGAAVTEIIKETIPVFHEYERVHKDELYNKVMHHIRAQMACKRAVKAGDALTVEAMNQLLTNLNCVQNRFCCPHGRPTISRMTKAELEKKFRR